MRAFVLLLCAVAAGPAFAAPELSPADLPDEVLPYLTGSRYCETQLLSEMAWSLFGAVEPGWARS